MTAILRTASATVRGHGKISGTKALASNRDLVWLVLSLCAYALMPGCRDEGAISWSKEVRSPDGQWLAIARTRQWSGPGTAYVATTVELKKFGSSRRAIEILDFRHEEAGRMYLVLKWLTPKHLDVTYDSGAQLTFQAVKCCDGVDITLRKLSNAEPDSPPPQVKNQAFRPATRRLA